MAGSVGEGHHILRGPLAVTAGWEDHPTRGEGKRGLTALGSGMLALRSNREPGQRTLGGSESGRIPMWRERQRERKGSGDVR